MNTLKPALLLFAMLALFTMLSCHKDPGKTIFQGYVTAFGTGEPIEGARIYISCETGPLFGQSQTGLLDSLVTDDKGYFHIEYSNRDICGGVFLTGFKEGYYVNTRIFTHSGLNDLEVVMDPEAWLKVITNPNITGNSISFTGTFTGAAGWDTNGYEGIKEYIFNVYGNRQHEIHWAYWGAQPPVTYTIDTFYLKAHDTLMYTLYY